MDRERRSPANRTLPPVGSTRRRMLPANRRLPAAAFADEAERLAARRCVKLTPSTARTLPTCRPRCRPLRTAKCVRDSDTAEQWFGIMQPLRHGAGSVALSVAANGSVRSGPGEHSSERRRGPVPQSGSRAKAHRG